MIPPPFTLRLFGPFQAQIGGQPLAPPRPRKVRWLLALLALRHGRAVSRDWLAGVLWPESEESRALQNLRNDLVSLRKALGPEAARLQSPARDSLVLDLAGAEVDVVRFDRAVQAGDEESLRDAVQVYAGPLLEGCYEEWVLAERDTRAQQCLAALETLAERAQERGSPDQAIQFLRRAEALDPLRDSTVRRLMAALAAAGDPAAAVEAYCGFRSRLHEELTAAPDEATTRLFYEIRARARATAGLRRQVPPLLPDQPASAPPELPPPPERLRGCPPPTPLTVLIGREEDLREIQERLAQSRLVTLVGAGGIGKTRLAMELAGLVVREAEGSAAWVELASITDEALVVPAIAAAMGLGQTVAGGGTLSALIGALLASGRLLVVLDNCEQVVDAVAAAVETLLQSCPDLSVLATSRERLALPGETVWRVPPLATRPSSASAEVAPGSAEALEASLDFAAARLFVERADAARPGFAAVDREGAEAIGTVCRRLDGIPLAIELAAARVSALTPRQIAERLDDRFAILTGGYRTALPRHRTLHALIDWSYALLNPDERALFRRLSVFVDGWTLDAAEAISDPRSLIPRACPEVTECRQPGIERPLDLLFSLADKSLALTEQSGAGLRYRMLETIREFGLQKLRQAAEEEAVRGAHLAYFLSLARGIAPELREAAPARALDRVDAAVGDFRAALAWAQTASAPRDAHAELSAALWPYWLHRGSHYEGCVHLQMALDRSQDRELPAWEQLLQGAYALGRALHIGSQQVAARWAPVLGDQLPWREGQSHARAALEQALTMHRRIGRKPETTVALFCLGLVSRARRDSERAVSYLREAAVIARELGNRIYLALTLHELGCVLYHQGADQEALEALDEALALFRQPGGEWGLGFACNNLGAMLLRLGDTGRSRRLYAEGLACYLRAEHWDGVVWSLEGLALAGMNADEARSAARLLGAASTARDQQAVWIARWDEAVAALRATLGEEAFGRAFESGQALSGAEAIELALNVE